MQRSQQTWHLTKHVFLTVNLEEELWPAPSGIQENMKIVCIISHSEATVATPVEEETEINSRFFFLRQPTAPSEPHDWCRQAAEAAVFSRGGFEIHVPAVLPQQRAKESFYTSPRCDIKCTAGAGRTCQRSVLMGSERNKGAQNGCKLANV